MQASFTLLELLVALAMMVALTGSLYACFRIAFRSRDNAEAALAPVRTAMQTMDLLRVDIESALPPTGILAGAFTGVDGKSSSGADSDTLTFFSCAHVPGVPAPDGTMPVASDIRQVQYSLVAQPNDATGTLFLLQRSITTNLLASEVPAPVLDNLCSNVLSLNLQYFDGGAWWDNWDSTQQGNALPTSVQVTLQLQPPAGSQSATGASPAGLPAAAGYQVARIFLLPCCPPPSGNIIQGAQGLPQ